jgi:heme exporter protein A
VRAGRLVVGASDANDTPALQASGLYVSYGPVAALRGVDLSIPIGSLAALLGPNAAGKTTLLKVLTGLQRPEGGWAAILGRDVVREPAEARAEVGYVADQPLAYPQLTVQENLAFFGRLYGLSCDATSLEAPLSIVGLWQRRGDRVGTLSRGLAQRLAIARAILHQPSVLLLDEPYTGLDPWAAGELDEALRELASGGRTVLLATHDMARAGALAESLLILHRGAVVWHGLMRKVPNADLAALYDEVTAGAGRPAREQAGDAMAGQPAHGQAGDSTAVRPAVASTRHRLPEARRRPGALSVAYSIFAKDVRSEARSREVIPPIVTFGLLVTVIFHFAFPTEERLLMLLAPGALWVALLFGSTLGLARAMAAEADCGGLTAMLASPADRGAVFLGKYLSGYAFALAVALPLMVAITILLGLPAGPLLGLAAIVGLGLVGWVAAGTMIAALTTRTRAREVLLPVVLFPLVLPLVIACVEASAAVVAGGRSLASALALVGAYDVVFLVLAYLLFPAIVEGAE